MSAFFIRRMGIFYAILMIFCAVSVTGTEENTIYHSVSRQLEQLPHRVPGTPEYYKAAAAIENTLRSAGIEVVRQSFQTPVPEMTTLRFEVAGNEIPIHALMPNNGGLISCGENPLKTEMIYCPGTPRDWKQTLSGRIVLLDWGSGTLLQTVFSEGAKAVVFVGNSQADQWRTAKALSPYQASFPCFYIEEAAARKAGLLEGKALPAVLEAQSRWKNVEGINLWACIPAGEKKDFTLNRPEALLLGARLDTFGMVPGLCRGDRERENAALLAQCAADLKELKLPRTVFVLFYGGSFNAYDGIRNFLFPFVSASDNRTPKITDFSAGLREERKKAEMLLEMLPHCRGTQENGAEAVLGIFHYSLAGVLALLYLFAILFYCRREDRFFRRLTELWHTRRRATACGGVLLLLLLLALPFILEKSFPGDIKKKQKESELAHETRLLLLREIVRTYNHNNYELASVNRKLRHAAPAEKAGLLEEKQRLDRERLRISNLRRGVSENKMSPELEDTLAEFQGKVEKNLHSRLEEIASEMKSAESWEEIARKAEPYTLSGSFFFDFSSDQEPFLMAVRGYENMHSFQPFDSSFYSKNFDAFKKIAARLPELQKSRTPLFLPALETGGIPVNLTGDSLAYLPSTPGIVYRLPGFTLRNIPGNYQWDELPGKREFTLSGLRPNMVRFLEEVARADEMSMFSMIPDSPPLDKYLNYYYRNGKYYGRQYYFLAPDGKEMDAPAAGAIVYLGHSEYLRTMPVAGFSNAALGLINSMGYVKMPALTVGGIASWLVTSPRPLNSGAMMFDRFGVVTHMTGLASSGYYKLFRCSGGAIPGYGAPLTTDYAGPLNANNAMTDNPFRQSRTFVSAATANGYAYADQNSRAKFYVRDETFLLNLPQKKGDAAGIALNGESLRSLNVHRQGFADTLRLNQERLDNLHRRNIFNGAIEQHHDNALEYWKDAEKSRKENRPILARAQEIFGQTLAIRAYRPLRQTIDDMIKSVLILLILTLPFSFAMERLLVCSANIYRQLGATFLFALGTFLLLYFTHPAFMLSQTPVVIFIAFFIILMSLSVIHIMMGRFQSEVAALQGVNTSAHRIQSSGGTFLAALIVGVSGMRNRPVKTFLTIMTVVLLTFTIISFASFDSSGAVRKVYFADSSSEDRIEVFLGNHMAHSDETMESIRELYQKDYELFFRSASSVAPSHMIDTWPQQVNYLYNPSSGLFSRLDTLAGFDPKEKLRSAALARIAPGLEAPEHFADGVPRVFISQSLAAHLKLKTGDICYVRSMKFRIGGLFRAAELDAFTFLDNGKVSGPNFIDTAASGGKTQGGMDTGVSDNTHFIWNAPDMTLITDAGTARKLNGGIHAAVLYPRAGVNIDLNADATRLAEAVYGMVYAGTADGVYKYFYGEKGKSSGLGEIIVPLLLGALIIFSSLLGSIADREKEIFTFSALGLSPFEVGLLFFAESAVYAVVGALGGYLLSQVTMTLLTLFSRWGWVQAPEMNYSSMSTVYTLLTVMAVVLLSTIYPAIKASRSATPDVARQWKMPQTKGDLLSFQFPFTVSAADFSGILVFIGEFFRNHEDNSLGNFASGPPEVLCRPGFGTEGSRLDAEIALAPFDLGVSEHFAMYASPSEIEGINVVCVDIRRTGGSDRNFLRANRRFVNEMRNQFLLWRSLPPETVVHYRNLADQLKNANPSGDRG